MTLSTVRRARILEKVSSPVAILMAVVLASSLLGLTDFNRFGESWDEDMDFTYGQAVLDHSDAPARFWEQYDTMSPGPAYLAGVTWISVHLRSFLPSWDSADIHHFLNHLTFGLATLALYLLCRMFVGQTASLIAGLLFASQPVLFGHSFINQKDVPFMAAFLVAAALGLRIADVPPQRPSQPPRGLRSDWREASRRMRILFVGVLLGGGIVCLELMVLMRIVLPALQETVVAAYYGRSLSVVNDWFAHAAQSSPYLGVDAYLHKANALYMVYRWWVVLAWLVGLGVTGAVVFKSAIPSVLWGIAAGMSAGLATSIRVVGLAVAGLVIAVVLLKRRWDRWPAILALVLVAVMTCFATWPALRVAPQERLWHSLSLLAHFPWGGGVLYGGSIYQADDLPWHYLPVLMGLQFTLPATGLAVAGAGIAVRRAFCAPGHVPEFAALLLWFAAPLAAAALFGSTVYNNFRQFLFVVPPLFVFGSIALEVLVSRMRSSLAIWLLAGGVLLPGVVGIVRLHPYEYVYYNILVGGVDGAFRSYEMDYWCTSYREAMDWINEIAPVNAEVAVAPPEHVARRYARSDLTILAAQEPEDLGNHQPTYGLGCGRGNNDLWFFPEYATAHEVVIQGARLAIIRDFQRPDNEGQN